MNALTDLDFTPQVLPGLRHETRAIFCALNQHVNGLVLKLGHYTADMDNPVALIKILRPKLINIPDRYRVKFTLKCTRLVVHRTFYLRSTHLAVLQAFYFKSMILVVPKHLVMPPNILHKYNRVRIRFSFGSFFSLVI